MTVHQIIIAFNNHFAGFGPESANTFLKLVNEPRLSWEKELEQAENPHPDDAACRQRSKKYFRLSSF